MTTDQDDKTSRISEPSCFRQRYGVSMYRP